MIDKKQQGITAKLNGKKFEKKLDLYFGLLKKDGVAFIEKTPEPYRYIRPYNGNLFIGCFCKQAQPDYKGVLRNGKAIVIEAKSVANGKINLSALTEKEFTDLSDYKKLGALTFVIVNDSKEQEIFLFPFEVFENMIITDCVKHIKLNTAQKYKVDFNSLEKYFEEITK